MGTAIVDTAEDGTTKSYGILPLQWSLNSSARIFAAFNAAKECFDKKLFREGAGHFYEGLNAFEGHTLNNSIVLAVPLGLAWFTRGEPDA